MSDRKGTLKVTFPADLILVEQSGVKREFPQLSVVDGMHQAADAMRCHGRRLREVKLVSHQEAVARWRADGQSWRRVA